MNQVPRRNQIDLVMVELMGIERWVHVLRQDDGSIQPFPQPRYAVRRGFDVEVQIGMLAPQFAHARKQPLTGKKGQHAEPKAKLVAILLDRKSTRLNSSH